MNDSALPAATWPTSKVPPLLCSSATSKVTGRREELVGWRISNVEGGREKVSVEQRKKSVGLLSEFLKAVQSCIHVVAALHRGQAIHCFQWENNGKFPASIDVRSFTLFCSRFYLPLWWWRQTRHWKAFQNAATSVCPAVLLVVLLFKLEFWRKRHHLGLALQFHFPVLLSSHLKWNHLNKSCPHSFSDIAKITLNKLDHHRDDRQLVH